MRDDLTLPGLVDLHVHAAGGVWATGSVADLRQMARSLAAAGTTAFCPTSVTGPPAELLALCRAAAVVMADPHPGEARVLGVHAEGPYISPARLGAQPAAYVRAPDLDEVAALVGTGALNRVTLAPEIAPAFVGALVATGVRVSLGHSDATYAQGLAALDAGATAVTHTFNAMRPWHHREPGLAGLAMSDPRVVAEVVADGEHVHPAVVRALVAARPGGVAVVSDAIGALEGSCCSGSSVRLADGTLAGTTATMLEMLANLVGWGIPLADAVAACSSTPARAAGATVVGDAVVVGPDFALRHVVVGGVQI